MKQSNSNSEPAGLMGFGLNFERNTSSSRHQTPKKGRDTAFPAQARPSLDCHNKLKGVNFVGQTHPDPLHRSSECGNGRTLVQPKMGRNSLMQSSKGRDKKDDELVKYMLNLPGYLQRLEREENLQDKALNVGVLDWTRLEQWKAKQVTASVGGKAPLLANDMLANLGFPSSKFSDAIQSGKLPSTSSNLVASCSGGVSQPCKIPVRNVKSFQGIGTSSKSSLPGIGTSSKSSFVSYEEITLENGKTVNTIRRVASNVGNQSSSLRNYGALVTPKQRTGASGGESRSSVDRMQLLQKEVGDQKINSSMRTATLKLRKHVTSHSEELKSNCNLETKKKAEGLQESSVLSHQPQTGEKKNIVLLVPKKFAKYQTPDRRRAPLDQNYAKADKHRLSHCVSRDDDDSTGLHSEIPCMPLPSKARINLEPCKTAHLMISTQGEDRLSDASHSSSCSSKAQTILSPRDHVEKTRTAPDADGLKTMKVLDQESAELASRKGRHPSPNRRFSFSLSRMSRSFSFKESSAIPHLNSEYVSVKSGPVMTVTASCPENSNREKASGHNRARSSPLRRILEPLLKSKSTVPPRSAETLPPLKGSLNSSSLKPTKFLESYPTEKYEAVNIQAVLQVTVKNGLPLFRFVVNNSSSVLAATTNNVTSSGWHQESVNNYTFYSIDEIKKKGGSWRHQGGKEKSCGYVYNVIGQMKLNSSCFLDTTERNSIGEYVVKESVLYGVELRQVEQASPKFIPSSELAAIVVKVPRNGLTLEMLKGDIDSVEKGFSEPADEGTCNVRVNEKQMSVTAILPGAIHSLPDKGGPSPLIHRWKSGGSCDCGGWDVGCKLHVLSTENKCCKISTESNTFLMSDHLQLFNQGDGPQDKPVFSFAPIEKGMHSVEFSQSISILQAFFISITLISCQKSQELAEMGILSEDYLCKEAKHTNDGKKKIHSTGETKTPRKYTPNPPLSPVGRV